MSITNYEEMATYERIISETIEHIGAEDSETMAPADKLQSKIVLNAVKYADELLGEYERSAGRMTIEISGVPVPANCIVSLIVTVARAYMNPSKFITKHVSNIAKEQRFIRRGNITFVRGPMVVAHVLGYTDEVHRRFPDVLVGETSVDDSSFPFSSIGGSEMDPDLLFEAVDECAAAISNPDATIIRLGGVMISAREVYTSISAFSALVGAIGYIAELNSIADSSDN